MKKYLLFFLILSIVAPILVNGQSYIDPTMQVEAKVFSYKLSKAPTIDADASEWAAIPWSESRYNDRDFNKDNLIDPMSSRVDYRARWKSAWVEGSNKIYFLFEIWDDQMVTDESVRKSHRDNLSIRLDPYDEEIAGEPQDGDQKHSFSIRFQMDNAENTGFEGNETSKPKYDAKVKVNNSGFPIKTTMEVELTLPENISLKENYVMGYFPLFADNDKEDDTPNDKNTVPMQWSQMYCEQGSAEDKDANNKLNPDKFWINDFWWGNLECISLNIKEVAAGSSIQTAIDAANEGDILKLAKGTYTENIIVNKPYIQLVGTEGTILKPADAAKPVITVDKDDVAYGAVIKGITFDGFINDTTFATVGIEIGSAQTEILNNTFKSFMDPTLKADVDSTKAFACVFEDNHVIKSHGGINFNTPGTIIRYNKIEENLGSYGITAKGLVKNNSIDIAFNTVFNHHGECGIGYGGSGTFTIHHNMLIRSEELYGSGDTSGDDGIENQDDGGSTDYIYNNTIVGWKSDGIQFGNGTSKFFVRNNLIAHCGGKDYDIRKVDTTDIDYGLSFQNKKGEGDLIKELGSHGLVEDPKFKDDLENDFSLAAGSPAIDAGLTEPFGFKVMYTGNAIDIGALEHGVVVPIHKTDEETLPSGYVLNQNYPNPFNPSTTISFVLPEKEVVKLEVFNVLGQKVETVINKEFDKGSHKVDFDASNVASGIYIYKLTAGKFVNTKKMVLLK